MNTQKFHNDQRGSAILLVLGILSLVLMLALILFASSRNARTMALAVADNAQALKVADSAANRAMGYLAFMQRPWNGGYEPTAVGSYTYGRMPYIGSFNSHTRLSAFVENGTIKNGDDLLNVFYTVNKDGDDDTFYNLLKNTKYGENLDGTATRLKSLRSETDAWKNAPAMENVYRKEGSYLVVDSRVGLLIVSEGSKFDINSILGLKNSAGVKYIPFVDGGQMNTDLTLTPFDDKDTNKDYDFKGSKNSIYGIMGAGLRERTDADGTKREFYGNVTDIVTDANKLRYGLHIQELIPSRTNAAAEIAAFNKLQLGSTANPPRWFNYDHLYTDCAAYANDITFIYNLASGNEELEQQYFGKDVTATDAFENKINLQIPDSTWTNTANEDTWWDKISKEVLDNREGWKDATDDAVKNNLMDITLDGSTFTLKEIFPIDGDVFQDEDGNDLTAEVLTNLIDFSDSDNTATYFATLEKGGTKEFLKYDSVIDAEDTINEPLLCGNERVPYVAGVEVTIVDIKGTDTATADSAKAVNKFEERTIGSSTVQKKQRSFEIAEDAVPRVGLKVSASIGNIFPEEIDDNFDYKFIVQGKLCLYYAVIPSVHEGTITLNATDAASVWEGYFDETKDKIVYVSQSYEGNDDSGYDVAGDKIVSADENKYNEDVAALVTANAKPFVVSIEKTDATTPDPFTFVEISSEAHYVDLEGKKVENGRGTVIGCGVRMEIEQVVVIAKNRANGEVSDIAYLDPTNGDSGVAAPAFTVANTTETQPVVNVPNVFMNYHKDGDPFATYGTADDESEFIFTNDRVIGVSTPEYIGIQYLVADPRLNHLNDGWRQAQDGVDPANYKIYYEDTTDVKNNIGYFINDPAAGGMPDLATKSISAIVDNCVNTDDPEFDYEPNLAEDGTTQLKTFSTAFVHNSPITSLWQLGAVHRGEVGKTINLKKAGSLDGDHKYTDGDAWLLDFFKLSELDADKPSYAKFNPNSFNKASYTYLFNNLPYDPISQETEIYKTLTDNNTLRMTTSTIPAAVSFNDATFNNDNDANSLAFSQAQRWSPVEAFYQFVKITPTDANTIDDRTAESFIGCTAGLLSTRYETFTIFAAGQSLEYLKDIDTTGPSADDKDAILGVLINPIEIDGKWYSVLGTHLRVITVVRDCWNNKFQVVQVQQL